MYDDYSEDQQKEIYAALQAPRFKRSGAWPQRELQKNLALNKRRKANKAARKARRHV